MADEAFALSPISARAALPGEQDYDAIREAFMETSRGRWFLGEYAKRNRNADTTMVLDAVARIEQAMAAQKPEPPRNDAALHEALAAIRGAVDEAAENASAALAGLELADKLTPIHKGARIIKEISWRWREIGADGRICDLIDSQLTAIEASCAEIARADGRAAALNAAFDGLRHKLDALADDEQAPAKASINGHAGRDVKVDANADSKVDAKLDTKADAAAAAESVAAPAAAIVPEPAAMFVAEETTAADEAPAATAFAEPEPVSETRLPEAAFVTPEAEAADVTAAAAPGSPPDARAQAEAAASLEQVRAQDIAVQEPAVQEPATQELAEQVAAEPGLEMTKQAVANQGPADQHLADQNLADRDLADQDLGDPDLMHEAAHANTLAEDEAVLEMVAMEMAAPDDSVDDDFPDEIAEVRATLPPVVAPSLAGAAEPPSAPRLDIAPPPAPPQAVAERSPKVAAEPSLGSTLVANGFLPRPKPQSDPLAAIRRMSQAEKVAFFS